MLERRERKQRRDSDDSTTSSIQGLFQAVVDMQAAVTSSRVQIELMVSVMNLEIAKMESSGRSEA